MPSFFPDSDRRGRILALALPIIGGMASQNVLNLVDTAMVGMLGASALAAVGMASFANFLATAFVNGLGTGVQAMAARRLGEGRLDRTAAPLNGGLLIAICVAIPWSVLLIILAGRLFPLLVDDPEVVAQGVPYLRMRLVAMVAMGMNFSFRGYWNGVNRSAFYMRTLIAMHVCNIVLNWILIFGHLGAPAMGVAGAGLGTAISTFLGTVTYIVLGIRHARPGGFLSGLPDRKTLGTMIRLAVPAGLQQTFFAGGMTTLFWIIGRVGTAELAASNVLVQLLLVAILPGLGFGMAAASLVGQSLGKGAPDEARRWAWDVARISMVTVGVVSLVGAVAPDLLLRFFLHEEATLQLARVPLQVVALSMWLDTVGMVLMNSLLGAGDNRRVMTVSILLQWVLFLPAAYLVGPVLGYGMLGIWIAQVVYRAVQAICFILMWHGGKWAEVEV